MGLQGVHRERISLREEGQRRGHGAEETGRHDRRLAGHAQPRAGRDEAQLLQARHDHGREHHHGYIPDDSGGGALHQPHLARLSFSQLLLVPREKSKSSSNFVGS